MEFTNMSLVQLAERLRSGAVDLLAYVDGLCDRIEEWDPDVRALLPEPGRRERLRREAEELLARFPEGGGRPALFGIPIGVKDIIRVEGFETGAGARLPAALFAGPEAAAVRRLRAAGGLVLGKTVTTEFAYFEPGPTRNPRNLGHTPGGSSSGSAAAVAAGFCPLALGTQTVGSVIRPAAYCGVVGFKPSYGRISLEGIIPFSTSADHVGLFAPDVAGIALAASALCEGWNAVERPASRRPILGVPEGPYLERATPEGLAGLRSQVEALRAAGYVVRHARVMEDFEAVMERHTHMIAAEFAGVHKEWFSRYEPLYRPRTAALIRLGQSVSPEELGRARAGRAALRQELEAAMAREGIDLWICPAAPGPAPAGIESTGDPVMNLPWTHAGMPVVSVPAGQAGSGLPLGLQIVGRYGIDELLLRWAAGLEVALASP